VSVVDLSANDLMQHLVCVSDPAAPQSGLEI